MPAKTVVTGASGFVGRALLGHLAAPACLSLGRPDWREGLAKADLRDAVVVHLAARVHEPHGKAEDFERDNVEKTRMLAEAAARAGAARFVFASTTKVHGEQTPAGAFTAQSPVAPDDPYALSKWHAEECLREIGARTGLPVVVVRFPLTYGPGVGGNFRALIRLADSGLPLPFGAIDNRRSLLHVDDLARALALVADHPDAPSRAFLAAHPVPVSTTGLLRALRHALGRPARLFPVPASLLEGAASVAGLGESMRRLTRSLAVDPSALLALGWQPRLDLAAGLEGTVRAWRERAAP